MKHLRKVTKQERKRTLSRFLRWGLQCSWNPRSYTVFEKHLNQAEDESLPIKNRIIAANKIDQMFCRRIKKHEQNK